MDKEIISHELLLEYLNYDKNTGIFTWLENSGNKSYSGKVAGSLHNRGYSCIRFRGKIYLAHRLAWFYVHGNFPKNKIDHINMNRNDNRIDNLREATQSENMRNTGLNKSNKHGVKGVSLDTRDMVWFARARINYKVIYLGRFKTKEEAAKAYSDFAKINHGEFYRETT